MTCTAKNEVDIVSLNGTVLTSFVNNQVETYSAKISPDAKLVGTSGISITKNKLKQDVFAFNHLNNFLLYSERLSIDHCGSQITLHNVCYRFFGFLVYEF